MPERAGRRLPPWGERERLSDLVWISENLHVFWPVAQQGDEDHGRDAIVVGTTQRPTGHGHPFAYFSQATVEQTADQDVQRMLREYDPSWEIVTVLLKTCKRVSVYRVGVVGRKPE